MTKVRNLIIVLGIAILTVTIARASSTSTTSRKNKCDVNGDSKVDISDITRYNGSCKAHDSNTPEWCDLNGDGNSDVSDDVAFQDKCMQIIAGFSVDDEEEEKEYDKCDLNKDSKIDNSDNVRFSNKCSSYSANGPKECDINGDGKYDISDRVKLTNCLAGTTNGSSSNNEEIEEEEKEYNKCDFNKDNTVDISDIVRYNNKCRAHETNSPKACDLNGDGKFDVSDDITFNDKCLNGEIAGYNEEETECKGMDEANVSHIVNGDIITLKWNVVAGDNVTVEIYDPYSKSYKNLGKFKMSEKKATYKLQWDGEQKFRFDNGCNSTVYKVDTKMTNLNKCDLNKDNTVDISDIVRYNSRCLKESNSPTSCDLNGDRKFDVSDDITFNDKCLNGEIAGYSKHEIISNFGTISIANPDKPSEGITIMDRNLGATSNDITSKDSYGYYYQRGNNYGFPSTKKVEKISAKQVDASSYGPGNYYYNDTFIIWNDWDSSNNNNLWGGGNDNANNLRGLKLGNSKDRQGPCPTGYHVPSLGEWLMLAKYWADTNDKTYKYYPERGVFELDQGYSEFRSYFKIPLAGEYYISGDYGFESNYRNYMAGNDYEYDSVLIRSQGNQENPLSHYRSSSPATRSSSNNARSFYVDDVFYFYVGNTDTRNQSSSIRCFKNTYEPTVTVETNKKSPDLGALVYIKKQVNLGLTTQYTLGIIKDDEKMPVYNVGLFSSSDCVGSTLNTEPQKSLGEGGREYSNGEVIEVINSEYVQAINSISYTYNEGKYVCISKKDYPDYFKVNGDSRKVYKYSIQNKINNQNNKYSDEMNNAYEFAYDNGITTINTIDRARMNGTLTRIEMAKMLSNYAINVLGKTPDTSKQCNFLDISNSLDAKYDYGVTKACQLGIMGQNVKNNKFRPYDTVTRAQFVSALSRMMYGINDGSGKVKYYEPHMSKLYNEGIISKKDPKMEEKRGNVMLMVYRASE